VGSAALAQGEEFEQPALTGLEQDEMERLEELEQEILLAEPGMPDEELYRREPKILDLRILRRLLEGWDIATIARDTGISRPAVYRHMEQVGFQEEFRKAKARIEMAMVPLMFAVQREILEGNVAIVKCPSCKKDSRVLCEFCGAEMGAPDNKTRALVAGELMRRQTVLDKLAVEKMGEQQAGGRRVMVVIDNSGNMARAAKELEASARERGEVIEVEATEEGEE